MRRPWIDLPIDRQEPPALRRSPTAISGATSWSGDFLTSIGGGIQQAIPTGHQQQEVTLPVGLQPELPKQPFDVTARHSLSETFWLLQLCAH